MAYMMMILHIHHHAREAYPQTTRRLRAISTHVLCESDALADALAEPGAPIPQCRRPLLKPARPTPRTHQPDARRSPSAAAAPQNSKSEATETSVTEPTQLNESSSSRRSDPPGGLRATSWKSRAAPDSNVF